eukprot:COSAG06_NODE_1290_length_9985_cov_3.727190_2_plen_202_part_00
MARHGSMAAGMMVPRLVLALLLPVAVTALDNGLAITREAMSSPVAARWLCAVCAASCVSPAGCGPAIHHAGRQIARSSLDQLCWGNRGNRLQKKSLRLPLLPLQNPGVTWLTECPGSRGSDVSQSKMETLARRARRIVIRDRGVALAASCRAAAAAAGPVYLTMLATTLRATALRRCLEPGWADSCRGNTVRRWLQVWSIN